MCGLRQETFWHSWMTEAVPLWVAGRWRAPEVVSGVGVEHAMGVGLVVEVVVEHAPAAAAEAHAGEVEPAEAAAVVGRETF